MMTSCFASAAMSFASLRAPTGLPIAGPAPPTLEVVKKVDSIWSKSRSARMRSINTEPTMPRQPTNPTVVMFVLSGVYWIEGRCPLASAARLVLEGFDHRRAHLGGRGRFRALGCDVGGA